MDRRRFLISTAGVALAGCADWFDGGENGRPTSPTGPTSPDLPVVDPGSRQAPSPIGYSNCAVLDPSQASYIFGHGHTLVQAECIPFDEGRDELGKFDINRLRGIAQAARSAGGTFFLTLLNWNGLAQQRASEQWYRDRIQQIIQEVGVDNIWFEGISEPGNGKHGFSRRQKSIDFQKIALEMWPGVTVQNGDDVSARLRDVHHCRYDALLAGVRRGGSTINSTDCTPILASHLSEAKVREVTRAAIAKRATLIMYDTSNIDHQNDAVIKWMGEEIRSA